MDYDIETVVQQCAQCQQLRNLPPDAPLQPWEWPEKPWSRLHLDYAGPFMGKMFLVVIDAHSKWIDVHATNSATSSATIEKLQVTFASQGLPEIVVTDNGTNFCISFKVKLLDGRTVRRHLDYVRRRDRLDEEEGNADDLSPPVVDIVNSASGASEQGSEPSSSVPPLTVSGRSNDWPPYSTGEVKEPVLAHPNNVPTQVWEQQPGHGSKPRQPALEQPSGEVTCRRSERLRKEPDRLQITWD
ncbi:uncharacterized protein LOC123503767 [Portunus trituberculatus]|uniref:uncharacterized protein LOC123503767 n=1 Tax=Portunus trituberculatus TaxID=210409 RepID=UPI001E1CF499|nr:uncharacterized protein LOC123503767 [Portunus trituberculatus]